MDNKQQEGEQDSIYDDSQLESLVPVSKDSLLVNAASYKARHLTKFSLDTARIFLTCCSLITLRNGLYKETGIALLDQGSSLGYCTLSFAKKAQMRQEGQWQGKISTIHGTKDSSHPIFIADLEDAAGKIHTTKLLGTKKIGYKDRLPDALFSDLCRDLKISEASLQNPGGPIDILLGLDVHSLLSSKHLEMSSSRHPELFVCSTPLFSQYFLSGAVGKDMLSEEVVRTLTFHNDFTCYSIDFVPGSRCHSSDGECDNEAETGGPWHLWSMMSRPLRLLRALTTIITAKLTFWGEAGGCPVSQQVCNYVESSPQYNANNVNIIKSSPHCDKLEDTLAVPSIHCQDCARRQKSCKVCKYLNSEMSLNDLRELQIIRSLISVRPSSTRPGKFEVWTDYPFTIEPCKAFAPEFSNNIAAKINSERLRLRLIKIGMADAFHAEMMKVKEAGHMRVRDDYTTDMSPQAFVFINYVEKSNKVSQTVRPVSNSGATNKRGYSLNNVTFSGPNFLNSGLQCLLSFRLHGG